MGANCSISIAGDPAYGGGFINEEKQRGEEEDGMRIKGHFCRGEAKQSTRRTRTMLISSASPQDVGEGAAFLEEGRRGRLGRAFTEQRSTLEKKLRFGVSLPYGVPQRTSRGRVVGKARASGE